jgi:hypothetical protein
MNITVDDATKVRRYLLTARELLAASHRETVALANRIKAIKASLRPGHLDYDGDVPKAMQGLSDIIGDLAMLKSTRPAVAGFGEVMISNVTSQLMPGVSDATEFLGKAQIVLARIIADT